MGICLTLGGLSVVYEQYMTSFILINAFLAFYQLSQGPVGWVYISEVSVDASAGFVVAGLFINMIVVIVTFEYMINSWLQAFGSFLLYGGITLFGFFFFLCFLKETRGLTDIQKKLLYSPLNETMVEMQEIKEEEKHENE